MQYTPAKAPDAVIRRDPFTKGYLQNQLTFLKTQFPDVDEDTLIDIIKTTVQERIKYPKCDIITYPTVGEIKKVKKDLFAYLREISDKMIAPSGVAYQPSNIVKAMSTEFTGECVNLRNTNKKIMFDYIEKKLMHMAKLYDFKQALNKIRANSIIGGSGTEYSAMYDKEVFGSITSFGRNGVIMVYGFTEQFLAGNYYFTTIKKLLNFLTITTNGCKSEAQVIACVKKHNLYIPSVEDVVESLTKSMSFYCVKSYIEQAKQECRVFLQHIPEYIRTYIYYRRNFQTLLTSNDALWRQYFTRMFTIDNVMKKEDPEGYMERVRATDPASFLTLHKDLTIFLTVVYQRILQGKSANKDLVTKYPEIAQEFSYIGHVVDKIYEDFEDILIVFCFEGEFFADIQDYKHMWRSTVAVSDTDSVLYTVAKQVAWYTGGDLTFCDKALNAAVFTIFINSQINDNINRAMAISKGIVTENNVRKINMKNEFLYSAFVKTCLGKHYFGYQIVKEGRKLNPPVLDKKGVEFQSSTLPPVSLDFTDNTLTGLLDDYLKNGKIAIGEYIHKCLTYEHDILKSLNSGDLLYYTNASVKAKAEYADPDKSIYFNYEFWEEVFAPTYGHIQLPGKFTLVPFKKGILRTREAQEWIMKQSPECGKRLKDFLTRTDGDRLTAARNLGKKSTAVKNIGRIVLPVTVTKLPALFTPLIDIRKIIYKNLAPAQLALRSLNVTLGPAKKQPLFMDHYSLT